MSATQQRGLDEMRAAALREEQEMVAAALTLRDEPEAIGRAIVDAYGELAAYHQSVRYRQAVEQARIARQALDPEDRLVDAMARARRAHLNLSGEFHVLRKMLERLRRGGRKLDTFVKRLERIEARLDGIDEAA
jgi:hypothetical protein